METGQVSDSLSEESRSSLALLVRMSSVYLRPLRDRGVPAAESGLRGAVEAAGTRRRPSEGRQGTRRGGARAPLPARSVRNTAREGADGGAMGTPASGGPVEGPADRGRPSRSPRGGGAPRGRLGAGGWGLPGTGGGVPPSRRGGARVPRAGRRASGDVLRGTEGKDALRGMEGEEALRGTEGEDVPRGTEGEDACWGTDGKNALRGTDGQMDGRGQVSQGRVPLHGPGRVGRGFSLGRTGKQHASLGGQTDGVH